MASFSGQCGTDKKADGLLTAKPSVFLFPLQILCQKNLLVISVFPQQPKFNGQNFKETLYMKCSLGLIFILLFFFYKQCAYVYLKEKTRFCLGKAKIYFIVSEEIGDNYLLWYVLRGVNHIIPVNDEK